MERRNFTIKILVNEEENFFIREKFNRCKGDSFQKRKSISEFLRDIILRSLLGEEQVQINNLEKLIKRTLSLTYKLIEKNYGEEEARKIITTLKINEKEN